jgi:hypothetical protein
MINISVVSKFWCGLLMIFGLLAIAAVPVHAATGYEVSQVTFSESGATGQYFKVTGDLTIFWTPPTVVAPNLPMNYYLKFNASPTQLTDLELNDTVYDFKVAGSLDHTVPAIPKATFDAYDYPQIHYLHIKTQYPTTGGFAFSDDYVVGPVLIDNVAPGGTMTLNPASGGSRQVNITLSPLEPIRYYWLSESSTYSPNDADGRDVSLFSLSAVWDLQSTALPPVQVPIYAWFQDLAGNRSTTYATTANYNYTTTVAIVYISSSVEVGGTLGFTVDGTTRYDWTITPSAGAASIASGNTTTTKLNAASITVNGLKAGTFTVSATPFGGGTSLTSGTITVVQSTKTVNISLSVGWNLISIPVQLTDTAIATVLSGITGKYSSVWGEFNPATTGWSSYIPTRAAALNTLKTLVPGKGYWINVTQAGTLSVTGAAADKSVNLQTGWNLIGCALTTDTAIATVLSGIAGKYSSVWGEFNPATTGWSSYIPTRAAALNTLKLMGAGKGYWINWIDAAQGTLSY